MENKLTTECKTIKSKKDGRQYVVVNVWYNMEDGRKIKVVSKFLDFKEQLLYKDVIEPYKEKNK
jgi:hypothetical protein